jgi:hypothetical protein
MVNTYHLVNPIIKGDNFENKITAKNSIEAANKLYKGLSKHFNHNVMKFYFSIQKGDNDNDSNGKFYHFQVTENRNEDQVKFKLQPHMIQNELISVERFKMKLNEFNEKFSSDEETQKGGKKKKKHKKHKKHSSSDKSSSSSSESDSDSDLFTEDLYRRARRHVPVSQPFYYWWYDPYLYSLDSVFIPTFYPYITPYIELSLKLP